jgi:hypothetical protein
MVGQADSWTTNKKSPHIVLLRAHLFYPYSMWIMSGDKWSVTLKLQRNRERPIYILTYEAEYLYYVES